MARRLPLLTEVFARLHQPHPEELLPEPVGGDARHERLLRKENPLGKIEPIGGRPLRGRQRWQEGGCGPRHLLPRLVVGPAQHDEAVTHLREVVEHERPHERLLEVVALAPRLDELAVGHRDLFRLLAPHVPQPVAADPRHVIGGGCFLGAFPNRAAERLRDVVELFDSHARLPPSSE